MWSLWNVHRVLVGFVIGNNIPLMQMNILLIIINNNNVSQKIFGRFKNVKTN